MFEAIRQQRWSAVSDEVARLSDQDPAPLSAVLAASPNPGTYE